MSEFSELSLGVPLQKSLAEQGYLHPTPIQTQAIPAVLHGRDILACAPTGTGKTAAFVLPLLHKITPKSVIQAVILSPTRELAIQIGQRIKIYGAYLSTKHAVIYGGVEITSQVAQLNQGVDLLVATPGRFLDLYRQGYIDCQHLGFFVLDEVDRMLDMGFRQDVQDIISLLPSKRQNLVFSATIPHSMNKLLASFLTQPLRIHPNVESSPSKIVQKVMFVATSNKVPLLLHLFRALDCTSSIVFTRTRACADQLLETLQKSHGCAVVLHGKKTQEQRLEALSAFRSGRATVLVATDVASRGIDIDGVSHVFNYEVPSVTESYIHRIGRTGRAGAVGEAITLCAQEEISSLMAIEKSMNEQLLDEVEQSWHCPKAFQDAIIARTQRLQDKKQSSKKRKKSTFRRRKPKRR